MKKILIIASMAFAAITAAISLPACADLGMGVDVSSGGVSPYWYGNGWLGNTYYNTPVWNYGPIYKPVPPRPPLIGNGPGSIVTPAPPAPAPAPAPRPPQLNPGGNGVPNVVGGIQRPGNGGLPNPSNVPVGRPLR